MDCDPNSARVRGAALQVWQGTHKASEHALVDLPCAVTSFYPDNNQPRWGSS
jgi:hypothetical protein